MNRRNVWRFVHVFGVLAILAAGVVGLFIQKAHTAKAATKPTVVTLQFDDGNADGYLALAMLNAHGMHATYYVNTGFIGDATHLSWQQLQDLFAAGDDIGGHTLTHVDIKKLKLADAHYQVCQDRDNLLSHG